MTDERIGAHTYTEILSQPQVWRSVLENLNRERGKMDLPEVSDYEYVLFTGCGSTHYLALWASRQFQSLMKVKSCGLPASEIMMNPEAWLRPEAHSLLVAISRSGKTSETLRAVKAFRDGGYGDTAAITCYPRNPLGKLTPHVLGMTYCQEESVAQTRSFTSMMLAIAWLLQPELPEDLPQQLESQGTRLIENYMETARKIAEGPRLKRFFFLGSGSLYGLACEAMLKMKEMSLSYAEAYHFLEFRHGPMSMIDKNSLVVGLISKQNVSWELDLLRDMKDLGAQTLAITENDVLGGGEEVDWQVNLDTDFVAPFSAPLYLPILQLIAYYRAINKKLNPDRPANLEAVIELDI
jgi:glucosamine--fructose-6-phosphate aminotransferase (isomerizing)